MRHVNDNVHSSLCDPGYLGRYPGFYWDVKASVRVVT